MTRYLYIPILVFILISIPAGVEGSEYAGPVDFTLEPVLSSEWGCYIEEGDLYIRSLKRGPLKVRASKDASGAILSPSLSVHGDTVFIAWVEQAGRDNTIRLTIIRYDGEDLSRKDVAVTDTTKATHVKLFTD